MIYDYLLTNCHSSTIRTRNDRRIIFQKENDSVVCNKNIVCTS